MGQRDGATKAPAQPIVDKLYMENTLLRVAGALFCHDAKRAGQRTNEIVLNRGVTEKAIIVRPDGRLGQPGPLAHKLFVALIKKHSDYGRPARGEVSFSKRELMRLIGRSSWGGANSEEISRALNEIHYSFVRTQFKAPAGRFVEHSFSVFPEVYLERAEQASDPIEACVVTLARPIVASLQDEHFTCLNHGLMRELGTMGQAIYMRLFFHFANLYDGHHKVRLTFQKRYGDICTEWLGGLTVLPHRSMIERDQLGPHLRRLVALGFLASYTLAGAANGDGFVLVFRPGRVFFADYDRFYRNRGQRDVRLDFHDDHRAIADPLKLAYLFLEKRSGAALKTIPYVSSREVETARRILADISFEEAGGFIDFALKEARRTSFDVQSLGGVRQYVATYLEHRERKAASAMVAEKVRLEKKQSDQRAAYDRALRAAADRLFATLPRDEQATIDRLAEAKQPNGRRGKGSLAATIFAIERARITAERHAARLPRFEGWSAT